MDAILCSCGEVAVMGYKLATEREYIYLCERCWGEHKAALMDALSRVGQLLGTQSPPTQSQHNLALLRAARTVPYECPLPLLLHYRN